MELFQDGGWLIEKGGKITSAAERLFLLFVSWTDNKGVTMNTVQSTGGGHGGSMKKDREEVWLLL